MNDAKMDFEEVDFEEVDFDELDDIVAGTCTPI